MRTNAALASAAFITALTLLPTNAGAQASSTAKQRAAIQRACANGTLSQDECTQKLAALQGGSQAGPPNTTQQPSAEGAPAMSGGGMAGGRQVKESHGRFTMTVPQGWNVQMSADSIKITQGDNWAIFETMSKQGEPLQVAQGQASQMQSMYTSWQVFNQGPFTTTLHHPAAGVTVGATVSTKTGPKQVVMLFAAQGAGSGNFVTMTCSSDQATAATMNPMLLQAFNSIRFAGE